jgi:peptidoglycan/LPS O-acetylase OafA/YrhL
MSRFAWSPTSPVAGVQQYRLDIDGLRAIAILSVVAFHADLSFLRGGFAGVDTFFVVSGYLIGGIVYREATSNTFSFARFYQRRAKRILPALFGILIASYLIALLLLSPAELRQFAGTALAAIFSSSNVQIWLTSGYFTTSSKFNPLLMTWSLAVEEQFYALFPIALLFLLNVRRSLVAHAVAFCSVLSFGIALWAVEYHATAAFFLVPTRAWEIGLGVLLAIRACDRAIAPLRSPLALHGLAAVGSALLVASFLLSKPNQFPGLAALVPVLGTLLLIETPGSFVNNFLSTAPIVFVGRLSYSWYLWHWPLLSFARIASDRPLPLRMTLSIAILSFFAAAASFYFIEEPFRHSKTPAPQMLFRYATLLFAISVFPLVLLSTKGLPQRSAQLALMQGHEAAVTKDTCLAAYGRVTPRLTPDCIASPQESHIIALLGDSHAAALAGVLRSAARKHGYALDEITKSSCPPLQEASLFMPNHAGHERDCFSFNIRTLDYLRAHPEIHTVVLASFWSGPFISPDDGYSYVSTSFAPTTISVSDSRKNLQRGLNAEVAQLQLARKQVILLKDAPVLTFDPVRNQIANFIPLRHALSGLLSPTPAVQLSASGRTFPYDDSQESSIIDSVAARSPGIRVYDLRKNLCQRGECLVLSHGSLEYIDSNHLSEMGAATALADLDLSAPETNDQPKTTSGVPPAAEVAVHSADHAIQN